MNYFREAQSPINNDKTIANNILNVIKEIISKFSKSTLPNNAHQIIVDMVYDYLFTRNNAKPIMNIFKVLYPQDASGSALITRDKVHPYSDSNINFLLNSKIDFSKQKAELDMINPTSFTKLAKVNKNIKTSGIEELSPELMNVGKNYGADNSILDSSALELVFGPRE